MPDWYLNRALTGFRNAVNAAYPHRDKASDGTVGDEAHQSGSSDHNPDSDGSVDAWDMDVNLRSSNDPAAITELKRVFQAHPSSKYWIHNDQICFRDEGWRPRSYAYAGPNRNQHRHHVHWNSREAYEDSTAPWILEDDMTPEEKKLLTDMAWQVRNVPSIAGGREVLTGAAGKLVERMLNTEERMLVAEKKLAGLAPASGLTPEQWAAVVARAEAEAREEVAQLRADLAALGADGEPQE